MQDNEHPQYVEVAEVVFKSKTGKELERNYTRAVDAVDCILGAFDEEIAVNILADVFERLGYEACLHLNAKMADRLVKSPLDF